MERISQSRLNNVCATLNKMTDSPASMWTRKDDGTLVGNVGHWHVDANGYGYRLCRVSNEGGAVMSTDIAGTARTVYDGIHVMLQTIYMIQRGDLVIK